MQGMEISKTPLFICAVQGGIINKNDVQEPTSVYARSDSPENLIIRDLSPSRGFRIKVMLLY